VRERGLPKLLGSDEIARRIQYEHLGWVVWFGHSTGEYWAAACWVDVSCGMVWAADSDALDAAISAFEVLHPKPKQRYGKWCTS
jgi:hypothetical protein